MLLLLFFSAATAAAPLRMSSLQTIEGNLYLDLNAGPDAMGSYVPGGSDESVLTFLYTVSEGDGTPDLDTNGQNSVVVPDGSSIKACK